MQKLKHNKKRNTGLLYEFFVRYIGKAVLDGRDSDLQKAKLLLKKSFNPSTDIFKELKLVKALSEANVKTPEQAYHLIERVRGSVKYQSQARLDLEKTALVLEVTNKLNCPNFFDENITEYKKLATIQVLLNTWRDQVLTESVSLVAETVELENRLVEWMLESNKQTTKTLTEATATNMTEGDVDRLVVSIMTEKVNAKYAHLSPEQKNIINLFVFAKEDESSRRALSESLSAVKSRFSRTLAANLHEFSNDKILTEKLNTINGLLMKEYSNTDLLSEEAVGFYLGLSKLESELKEKQ